MRPLIGLESNMTSNEHKVVYPGDLISYRYSTFSETFEFFIPNRNEHTRKKNNMSKSKILIVLFFSSKIRKRKLTIYDLNL